MVSGYNVDIRHAGKVYHVQTEDRGRRNPVIETLVYEGGRILHQERVSYADQNDDEHYAEASVARILELQHKRIVDAIRAGRFDTDRRPFGEEFITDRTFDECVLAFLVEEAKAQAMELTVTGHSDFAASRKGWLVVRTVQRATGQPVANATVRSRLIRSSGVPETLPEVRTGANGEARLEFEIHDWPGHVAIVVQAESEFGREELHKLLR